jgi:hypothetical protein
MNDVIGRAACEGFCPEGKTLHCDDIHGLRLCRGSVMGVGCGPARDRDAGF